MKLSKPEPALNPFQSFKKAHPKWNDEKVSASFISFSHCLDLFLCSFVLVLLFVSLSYRGVSQFLVISSSLSSSIASSHSAAEGGVGHDGRREEGRVQGPRTAGQAAIPGRDGRVAEGTSLHRRWFWFLFRFWFLVDLVFGFGFCFGIGIGFGLLLL
jgi:hypothetical protein